MAHYDALIAKWPEIQGRDLAEKLAALNALTAAGPNVDVPVSRVEGYLSLRGILTHMEDWLEANPTDSPARTAAKELLRTISSPHVSTFSTNDPMIYAALGGMLDALIDKAIITDQHKTDLLAFAATTVSWREANGYSGLFNLEDLKLAGLS